MSKAGILTFYYKNYNMGGMLQAYALQRAIEYCGAIAEQISFDYKKTQNPLPGKSNKGNKIKKMFDAGLVYGCISLVYKSLKKICLAPVKKLENRKIQNRIKMYDKFAASIPHSEKIYSADNIENSSNDYDIFICGGDQIWNNWNWMNDDLIRAFTLNFVDDSKIKFSYSASTGKTNINTEFLRKMEPGVCRLDAVSVREKSSVAAISQITRKKVYAMPDPVLLLNAAQWDNLADCYNAAPEEPYIFCYFLSMDKSLIDKVKYFARVRNIKTLTLPYMLNTFRFRDLLWGDIRNYTAGPGEFVDLIRNAELILTDSFHALAFSVIYHKQFYVFGSTRLVSGTTMNIRVTDFLEEFGLESRLLQTEDLKKIKDDNLIDYSHVDKILEESKKKGYSFLKDGLKKEK